MPSAGANYVVPCAYECGHQLTIASAMVEVIGWTRKRSAGGANHISNSRETKRYAHRACVEENRIESALPEQWDLL